MPVGGAKWLAPQVCCGYCGCWVLPGCCGRVPAPSSRHRHREASQDTVVVNKRLADLIEQNGYYVPNSALQRLARKENSSLILNRTNLITRPTDNLPLIQPHPDGSLSFSHSLGNTNVPATSASVDEDSVVSTDSQSHSPASTTEADVEATSDEISIAAPYNSDSQGSSEHLADGIDFFT
ncbi:uncharacterized protein SAPINGB_P002474 [Magnusiomyces paraingens]|uniref:Uncharacterized protein n=1 Tax=Magnusiomyces paraingens TaxID=2606893 RepID=A0A5E8BEC8_9ASCO|nr:uncharacterized protein SAPINGB_P002474 [Saprochaete ingens]VVT49849.1 unnamed protein product [Saprochaete ingens]